MWDLDNPDIPIEKPKEITELEQMGRVELDSMPPREMEEKVEEAAHAIAKSYKRLKGATYSECVALVAAALETTGAALGGEFGMLMVGRGDEEAIHACRLQFPEEEEEG